MAQEPLNTLLPLPLAGALSRVKDALKAEGFGVLTEVDVQATLHEKLGTEFYPYLLLGVCNPSFAYRALELDPSLGVFLPCTVAVYDTGVGTEVRIQDPTIAVGTTEVSGLADLVSEVRERLARVVESLRASVEAGA